MSTHKTKPHGMVAVRRHDGDVTITTYEYPPAPGSGKHSKKRQKRSWSYFGDNNNKGKKVPA